MKSYYEDEGGVIPFKHISFISVRGSVIRLDGDYIKIEPEHAEELYKKFIIWKKWEDEKHDALYQLIETFKSRMGC